MDETCRLRRGEGYGACEDESASFLPILFWQGRKEWAAGGTVAVLLHSTALSVPDGNPPPFDVHTRFCYNKINSPREALP